MMRILGIEKDGKEAGDLAFIQTINSARRWWENWFEFA